MSPSPRWGLRAGEFIIAIDGGRAARMANFKYFGLYGRTAGGARSRTQVYHAAKLALKRQVTPICRLCHHTPAHTRRDRYATLSIVDFYLYRAADAFRLALPSIPAERILIAAGTFASGG